MEKERHNTEPDDQCTENQCIKFKIDILLKRFPTLHKSQEYVITTLHNNFVQFVHQNDDRIV